MALLLVQMKKLYSSFLIFILYVGLPVKGQFFVDAALPDSSGLKMPEQKFGLRISSIAFFKNNEYFHPLVEGYTLPGFQLQPRLYYDLGEKFSLEAGVHLSQFSGKDGLNSVDPLFRATYNATPKFSVLLGWLKGTANHQLIEPFYQWEKLYTDPLEYGVQFLVDKPGFKLDTWIDWEKYIELNDPFQEELTFGTTTKIRLLQNGLFEFWIPVQATIKHKGGQAIAVDEPLTTHTNWVTGFNVVMNRQSQILRRLMFDFYYAGFSDFSPQKRMPFKNGYGMYSIVTANISSFTSSLGYWRGRQFIAPHGEPLFQSVSFTDPFITKPDRYVITFKTSYLKQIFRNVSFGAYFESYYDIKLSQMDYDYGISMTLSGDILIKKK